MGVLKPALIILFSSVVMDIMINLCACFQVVPSEILTILQHTHEYPAHVNQLFWEPNAYSDQARETCLDCQYFAVYCLRIVLLCSYRCRTWLHQQCTTSYPSGIFEIWHCATDESEDPETLSYQLASKVIPTDTCFFSKLEIKPRADVDDESELPFATVGVRVSPWSILFFIFFCCVRTMTISNVSLRVGNSTLRRSWDLSSL